MQLANHDPDDNVVGLRKGGSRGSQPCGLWRVGGRSAPERLPACWECRSVFV